MLVPLLFKYMKKICLLFLLTIHVKKLKNLDKILDHEVCGKVRSLKFPFVFFYYLRPLIKMFSTKKIAKTGWGIKTTFQNHSIHVILKHLSEGLTYINKDLGIWLKPSGEGFS